MKKTFMKLLSVSLAGLCCAGFTACSGKSTALGKPEAVQPLSYEERRDESLRSFGRSADAFSSSFSPAVYRSGDGTENFAVSPLSVYMGLSLAAECSAGQTREELLSALGVSYESLSTQFSGFYRSLTDEYRDDAGRVKGKLALGNSVWVNDGTAVKDSCIRTLADKYYAYSYSADFAGDNKNANLAVRSFVKKQTNGLIDRDFDLSEETVFTLINTLYLKDMWNVYGDDLPFTKEKYTFTEKGGQEKNVNLLQGYYISGRAYEAESYTHFYTRTYLGYRLKFLLPKEGRAVDDVFTAENLSAVNALTEYGAYDDERMLHYNTRCLFPEFSASFDGDVKEILRSAFGLNAMFDESLCDFSALTDDPAVCGGVRHIAQLKVTKKGIEGAAATVFPAAGAPGPGEYTEVYEDFTVDRPFAFIVADPYGNTLFSGVVNHL